MRNSCREDTWPRKSHVPSAHRFPALHDRDPIFVYEMQPLRSLGSCIYELVKRQLLPFLDNKTT